MHCVAMAPAHQLDMDWSPTLGAEIARGELLRIIFETRPVPARLMQRMTRPDHAELQAKVVSP
jgi:hypothetical protein